MHSFFLFLNYAFFDRCLLYYILQYNCYSENLLMIVFLIKLSGFLASGKISFSISLICCCATRLLHHIDLHGPLWMLGDIVGLKGHNNNTRSPLANSYCVLKPYSQRSIFDIVTTTILPYVNIIVVHTYKMN